MYVSNRKSSVDFSDFALLLYPSYSNGIHSQPWWGLISEREVTVSYKNYTAALCVNVASDLRRVIILNNVLILYINVYQKWRSLSTAGVYLHITFYSIPDRQLNGQKSEQTLGDPEGTGKPGVLQSMGLWRVDQTEQLNHKNTKPRSFLSKRKIADCF